MLVPRLPLNLGRTLPNINSLANKPDQPPRPCICELLHPTEAQLHCMPSTPTVTGRTRHVIQTDVTLLRGRYPALAEALRLQKSFCQNEPRQSGDGHDLLRRLLAKLDEWGLTMSSGDRQAYRAWVADFTFEATLVLEVVPSPREPDPLQGDYMRDLQRAKRDGICISTLDKSNGFAWMCDRLPSTLLQAFMDNPDRYECTTFTQKMIYIKNAKRFKEIYGESFNPLSLLPLLIPTLKNHKDKKNLGNPWIEWKLRPVTSYANRGNMRQQRDLSLLLAEVELFHCPAATSHVVTSSVDFLQKLRCDLDEQHTFDAVGMFDSLNLSFAVYALSELLQELFEHKRASYGEHAHMRFNQRRNRITWSRARPQRKNSMHFPQQRVKLLLRYLLHNDFVYALGKVYRSIAGCPMGANASSKVCSLTAYFCERHPLRDLCLLHPNAQLHRYADDIHINFATLLFKLYFEGSYAAAGFTMELVDTKGVDRRLSFLETEIHLGVLGSQDTPWCSHYSKQKEIFIFERSLPHGGDASSRRSQYSQLQGTIRRIYHNTDLFSSFIADLQSLSRRHPSYTGREFAKGMLSVLENTTANRYNLTTPELNNLYKSLTRKQFAYLQHQSHTAVYNRP